MSGSCISHYIESKSRWTCRPSLWLRPCMARKDGQIGGCIFCRIRLPNRAPRRACQATHLNCVQYLLVQAAFERCESSSIYYLQLLPLGFYGNGKNYFHVLTPSCTHCFAAVVARSTNNRLAFLAYSQGLMDATTDLFLYIYLQFIWPDYGLCLCVNSIEFAGDYISPAFTSAAARI